MNKTTMIAALSAKIDELLAEVAAMEDNLNLSASTVRTQTQLKKHEARNLIIMKTLLEGKELTGDVMKWFESATTLKFIRKTGGIVFHDGDNVFEVQQKYPNKCYAQLKKSWEAQGFHLDGQTIRK